MLDPDGREARSCRGSDPGQAGLLKLPHGQCHQLIAGMHAPPCCHLPLQEVDIFDNKLEFSEIKIAIGQGFLVVQLQSSFKVT